MFASGTVAPFIQPPSGTYILVNSDVLTTTQIPGTGTTLLTNIKTAVNANHPVVIGVNLYTSFESSAVAANGFVPMPSSSDTLADMPL